MRDKVTGEDIRKSVRYIEDKTNREVIAIEINERHYKMLEIDNLESVMEEGIKKIDGIEIRIKNDVEWPTYIYNDVTIDKKPNPYFGIGEIETI